MLFDGRHLIRRGCLASMIFLAMVGSVGCRQSEEPQPGNGTSTAMEVPMTFRASGTASESRGMTEDALGNNFAVAVWKTNASGAKEMVMSQDDKGNSPYIVRYDAGQGWHYADLPNQYMKYWDLSAQDYTFYAIANYQAIKEAYHPTATFLGGYASIENIDAKNPVSSTMMESWYKRDGQALVDYDLQDDSKEVYHPVAKGYVPAYADIVPLIFHPMLSKVQFKIYNTENHNIALQHVSIKIDGDNGIFTTGNYQNLNFVYNASHTQEKVFVDGGISENIGYTKENATTLWGGCVLPQGCNLNAEVEIITDQGTFFGTIWLGQVDGRKWDKHTVYTYLLVVSLSDDIILVDTVLADPWEPYKEKEEIQTNW